MNRAVIACKVIEAELRPLLPADCEFRSLEQGLHQHPDHLRETLQREIDSIDADEILLAYGLCGKGVVGLRSEKARLVVPRVDDCISMLLGSYERYRDEFEREPGTYWLSHGWIREAQDPYKEYQRVRQKYDEETARWVAHETMKGYHRVALVETTACPIDEIRPYAREFAEFFDLTYGEMQGSMEMLKSLTREVHAPSEFVVVEPGQSITEEMFFPSVGLPNG